MSEIVNLRQARKAKARAAATEELERRRLDAHRRDREPGSDDA